MLNSDVGKDKPTGSELMGSFVVYLYDCGGEGGVRLIYKLILNNLILQRLLRITGRPNAVNRQLINTMATGPSKSLCLRCSRIT